MNRKLLAAGIVFLVVAVAGDLIISAMPSGELTVVNQWGTQGGGPGEFNEPIGIAVDRAGNIYVADVRNSRIQKFAPDGKFLLQWGREGEGKGEFQKPVGVALGAEGKVYVIDYDLDRVQVFSGEGTFLDQWKKSDGDFGVAAGIGIDVKEGAVYIAEFYGKIVEKFTLGGKFVGKVGSSGRALSGALHYPTDVFVDPKGNVYVADAYNNRIQKFDKNGGFVAKWGGPLGLGLPGKWGGWFKVPSGVAVDDDGRVYVADSANRRVVAMSPDGDFLAEWKIKEESLLFSPTRAAVGNDGTIYAADTARNRIVALKYRRWKN